MAENPGMAVAQADADVNAIAAQIIANALAHFENGRASRLRGASSQDRRLRSTILVYARTSSATEHSVCPKAMDCGCPRVPQGKEGNARSFAALFLFGAAASADRDDAARSRGLPSFKHGDYCWSEA